MNTIDPLRNTGSLFARLPHSAWFRLGLAILFFSVMSAPASGQDFTRPLPKSDPTARLIAHARYLEERGEVDRSRRIFRLALADAYRAEDPARIIHSAAALTYHFTLFAAQDSVAYYAAQLMAYALERKLPEVEMYALLIQTGYLTERQLFNDALEKAEKARLIARQLDEPYLDGLVMFAIGRALRNIQRSVVESNKYFYKAQEIFEESRDTFRIIRSALFIAEGEEQYDAKRNAQFEKVRKLLVRFHDPRLHMTALMVMARYESPREALEALEEALKIARQMRIPAMIQGLQLRISEQYLRMKQYQSALETLDQALAACPGCLPDRGAGQFYAIYKAQGEEERALFYLEELRKVELENDKRVSKATVEEWEAHFQSREKDWFIEQQQRINQLLIAIVVLTVCLLIGAGVVLVKMRRDRKRLSRQNRLIQEQAEALHRLDASKSRFFANLSHELRTPLTLMLAPISAALKTGDLSLLKDSRRHGKQLLRLIENLLDLARLDASRLEVREAPRELHAVLSRIAGYFMGHADSLGIHFSFGFRGDKNQWVLLDEKHFETIVSNLLSNAFKFTPPGGQVRLFAEELSGGIRLEVSDTGRGIHPDDLPRIFDRFFQSSQPDAPIEGGAGIGLAICRELARLMEGRLWAESRPGRGSLFFFEFPIRKTEPLNAPGPDRKATPSPLSAAAHSENGLAPAQSSTDALPAPAQDEPASILVVEDHPALRDFLYRILSPHYRVTLAANGQDALRLLDREEPEEGRKSLPVQLILSDIMMPVMDGFQLLRALKSHDRLRHLPVVMLTARADMQDKLQALRIGVDDYILKPFETDELLLRIKALLQNSRQRLEFLRTEPDPSPEPPEAGPAVAEEVVSRDDQEWLAGLETAVEAGMGDFNFTMDILADQLATSRSVLFRRIRLLTGLTPNEYVNEVRFRRARILLETRQVRSVKAAAHTVGMKDVKYFSRLFLKRQGKSPSELLE